MPQRPRQHQLEGISIHYFEGLLPSEWVCRRKGSDYGVDLEIEVFDEDGTSTGLTFIVQVKATDDANCERKTSIKLDRLQYLAGHDVPSMVVRYCHPTKTVHFAWVTNLFSQVTDHNAKSVTIHFEENDVWTDSSPSTLQRTLIAYRRLKHPLPSTPIGLTVIAPSSDAEQQYELDSAISELRNGSEIFTKDHDPSTCLPVGVTFENGGLVVAVDVLSSVREFPASVASLSIQSAVLYALALICGRFSFHTQCLEICRMISEARFLTASRFIAAQTAIYSIENPAVASELAARNGLHTQCDEHHFEYLAALQTSAPRTVGKRKAIERLILDTIDAHREAPENQQATLHYNFANFQMNEGNFLAAVMHFNKARKKNPEYLQRAYFLREFGSCLYFRRRFSSAASLYSQALILDPKSQTAICAGDALMYSGAYKDAIIAYQKAYEAAQAEENQFHASEAWLKSWLCSWMPDFFSSDEPQGTFWLSHRPFWMKLILDAEVERRYDLALAAALLEGFISEGDEALWADAVAFAYNTNDSELIQSTLSCAVWRFGHGAYGRFRVHIKDMNMPTEMIELLDGFVSDLENKKQEARQRGFIARFPGLTSSSAPHEIRIGERELVRVILYSSKRSPV